MSGGAACTCPRSATRRDTWRIVQYHCNHSKFNGSRYTPSDYSEIRCNRCHYVWRTRAAYVETLKMEEI
ncbi:hypothetical protein LCGC14_2198180 [marine sediment metagenome]|uniref:Uncharacterized protein n=1 Tax=marine sediment metagenome TaxID=412755 RepID=A0A0F9DHN4_9ZZZZ